MFFRLLITLFNNESIKNSLSPTAEGQRLNNLMSTSNLNFIKSEGLFFTLIISKLFLVYLSPQKEKRDENKKR